MQSSCKCVAKYFFYVLNHPKIFKTTLWAPNRNICIFYISIDRFQRYLYEQPNKENNFLFISTNGLLIKFLEKVVIYITTNQFFNQDDSLSSQVDTYLLWRPSHWWEYCRVQTSRLSVPHQRQPDATESGYLQTHTQQRSWMNETSKMLSRFLKRWVVGWGLISILS